MPTKIEWTATVNPDGTVTPGETWNPLAGCSLKSTGCKNCYAEVMAKRLQAMARADLAAGRGPGKKRAYLNVIGPDGKWNGRVETLPEALEEPLRWFVNSMSDLFWGDENDLKYARHCGVEDPQPVPFEFVDRVFAVMALCPQHTFQVLTKRPARMRDYVLGLTETPHTLPDRFGAAADTFFTEELEERYDDDAIGFPPAWPLSNVWVGVSCERQQEANERIPLLLQTPAVVRFLSCEPLLSAIDLRPFLVCGEGGCRWAGSELNCSNHRPELNWVIAGGESGAKPRPMHPDWVRRLRDDCRAAGVAFFFKQWGGWAEIPFDPDNPPGDRRGERWLNLEGGHGFHGERVVRMRSTSKTRAGRLLDGVTHDAFPEARP